MATTYSKTAIALQGGGALGAYSFGALKYIYESEHLTVIHSKLLPTEVEKYFAYFGNWNFYLPRQDYYDLPLWTSFYDLTPIKATLAKYVDISRIALADVKLVITATDIESGEIKSFDNNNPDQPITIDHIIARVACRRVIRQKGSVPKATGMAVYSTRRRFPHCSIILVSTTH